MTWKQKYLLFKFWCLAQQNRLQVKLLVLLTLMGLLVLQAIALTIIYFFILK